MARCEPIDFARHSERHGKSALNSTDRAHSVVRAGWTITVHLRREFGPDALMGFVEPPPVLALAVTLHEDAAGALGIESVAIFAPHKLMPRTCIHARSDPRPICCQPSGGCSTSMTPPGCNELPTAWHRRPIAKSKLGSEFRAWSLCYSADAVDPRKSRCGVSGGLASCRIEVRHQALHFGGKGHCKPALDPLLRYQDLPQSVGLQDHSTPCALR